ncbi:TlpA family protein disulfide reductase [Sabulilitoribacter multivorans]|uniref:TlpA family protein disulfide reductase n=1 Tax=Flaviramulus multivorans TaxID=1304750 RepID=A0ABS9IGV1_9FLAO|nr:TlpA disulfide reductase family protein [Flaviramulus multivorans]MCF7559997.1 TlpA family protein disulfide reductase [Flaviramulus multivorans]
MRSIFILATLLLFISCKEEKKTEKLDTGTYRALLKVNDMLDLPFNFEVLSENTLKVFNAEEVIDVDDITYENDSVYIKLPVFEGFIAAKIDNKMLQGYFIKPSLDRVMEFKAEKSTTRFDVSEKASFDISGNWETVFSPDSEDDTYIAKGIFKQQENKVTGTFRTTTGDYRFLEGVLNGNQLQLSAFDGAHAFMFTAAVTDSTLQGMFYSGNHFKEPFVAKRNEAFELPDANALTFLKEGYDSIAFTFPDENGNMVSLNDARFKNKVVLVQIMGTWCPNCLDESKYYAEYYKNNNDKDLEIIALAFEYAKTEASAFKGIKRLKERTGITYPVLLAQIGSSSKQAANEKLPMLNHVLSYPTTIYIDKKGKVRKIHTGFNGPATGDKFTEFKTEFNDFVDELLSE